MHNGSESARTWGRGTCVAAMLLAATCVSTGGVGTRLVERASGLEIAFWRSVSAACFLCVLLPAVYGCRRFFLLLRHGGVWLLFSALCWAVMFTAFMWALTFTSVANVFIVLALDPLLATVMVSLALGYRVPARSWLAGCAACVGIGVMFASRFESDDLRGTAIALLVPIAASVNWTIAQHLQARQQQVDLVPAVMLGAAISALVTLPFALPFDASSGDIVLLSSLGLFQCAIPCAIAVVCARTLKAPELALLALVELVCGIAWAWAFGFERPVPGALAGGAIVLAAVAWHELLQSRSRPAAARANAV